MRLCWYSVIVINHVYGAKKTKLFLKTILFDIHNHTSYKVTNSEPCKMPFYVFNKNFRTSKAPFFLYFTIFFYSIDTFWFALVLYVFNWMPRIEYVTTHKYGRNINKPCTFQPKIKLRRKLHHSNEQYLIKNYFVDRHKR